MRNQRAGQATFIPLDTIQVKPINDKFRAFAKGARLAVDVIQYEPVMERAIHHACGNALVCDTMEVARYVCYEKGQEVKGARSVCQCVASQMALTRHLWGSGDARRHDHPQKRLDHWWTQLSRQREEVGGERHPGYVLLAPDDWGLLIRWGLSGLSRARDNIQNQMSELAKQKPRNKEDDSLMSEMLRLESVLQVTRDDLVRACLFCHISLVLTPWHTERM